MKICLYISCFALLTSCAALHHVQIGQIDNRESVTLRPIELKVSEMGVDLNDARLISKAVLKESDAKNTNDALRFIEYFQMGPHTGAGVYSLDYIKNIDQELRSQCADGTITGVMTIRETMKYPVISGEIIKIKAYCAVSKGG